jgi:hypothetical protein
VRGLAEAITRTIVEAPGFTIELVDQLLQVSLQAVGVSADVFPKAPELISA